MKIYGKNPCQEILNTDRKIHHAYLIQGANKDIESVLKNKGVKIEFLDKNEFKKQFLGNHQGVVLDVEDYKTFDLDSFLEGLDIADNPLVLMLDGITDPHNFGAIIRTAEAGGVAGIIIPKNRSASINSTVAKVSSGAIEYVKVVEVTNLRNTIEKLKKQGFWTVGTDLSASKSHHEIDVSTPLLLVIGSEGKGVSKLVKETVDYNVKIDMIGRINSLNASVSAGILIFEILRKKQN